MGTEAAAKHVKVSDFFAKYVAYARELGLADARVDLLRDDGVIEVGGREIVNFGSCGYLGLNTDPRVIESAKRALDRFSSSLSSSPRYMAASLYGELIEKMNLITGAHVLLAPTTTLGHIGAVPVLVGPDDMVFMDRQSHSSVHTACEILKARQIPVMKLPHNDMTVLNDLLEEHSESYKKVWYFADGLYSMHGDYAPFGELSEMLTRFGNLHLYVDDAHGFGWAGRNGRGMALEQLGVHPRIVVSGGLSKSFGANGGFLAFGDPDLPEYVGARGTTFTFSGPIPPASLGAGVAAADILLSDEFEGLQQKLYRQIEATVSLTGENGLDVMDNTPTPVWFVRIGEAEDTAMVAAGLLQSGFFTNASVYPVVPMGESGIRFTNTNLITMGQLEAFVSTMGGLVASVSTQIEVAIDLTSGDELERAGEVDRLPDQ